MSNFLIIMSYFHTIHSFHVTLHPYRNAHLWGKITLSSFACHSFFLKVCSKTKVVRQ